MINRCMRNGKSKKITVKQLINSKITRHNISSGNKDSGFIYLHSPLQDHAPMMAVYTWNKTFSFTSLYCPEPTIDLSIPPHRKTAIYKLLTASVHRTHIQPIKNIDLFLPLCLHCSYCTLVMCQVVLYHRIRIQPIKHYLFLGMESSYMEIHTYPRTSHDAYKNQSCLHFS